MDWAQPDTIDLFADQRKRILNDLLLEMIFSGNTADYENYSSANSSTQSTIWKAQTQSQKLSLVAEEFFKRVGEATGTPISLRKRDFYRLIERQDLISIDPEVTVKLDAILQLLQR